MSRSLPDRARIVVIGGGVIGASIAYHLVQRGEQDVLLLEQDRFTSGTTWHAAGLVAQLRATENLTRLSRYSLDLYSRLEAETGQATGFRRPGAITLATSAGRFEEIRRAAAMAATLGVEAHVLSVGEVADLWPGVFTDDLVGAVHLPEDGTVSPVDVTMALLAGAKQGGAQLFERTKVEDLIVKGGRIAGVVTKAGPIEAESVVLATGMWTRDFAARYGVTVPLHAAEHYYVITQPIEGLSSETPILRDPGNSAYFKEDAQRLLVGIFEPVCRPWGMNGIPNTSFMEIEADLDHLTPLLERAYTRLPFLHETELRQIFCGPESFTPDDNFIMGEAPTLPGLFVAAGFNSIGIQTGGGVGLALADWILDGEPSMDLSEVDISRFEPFHAGRRFLHDRTVETLGLLYQVHWPHRQYDTARGLKHSALHERHAEAGACFGETAGWERPNFYAPKGEVAEYRHSFGRPNWFAWSGAEHRATREAVGFYDQSSYAKFILEGPDAESILQAVSAADMAVEPGKIVYTQWLNSRGCIEADLTVVRLREDQFMIVTGPAVRTRDFHHLRRASEGRNAVLTDMTSGLATLSVMGPSSRALLEELTSADLSDATFPFATSQEIELGYAPIRAMRITYVGELGWELYVPTEMVRHVYDEIVGVGEPLGLTLCGFHALASCRLEKGYRHFGHDIGPEDTPIEAGLSFAVAFDKQADFKGRDALVRQRAEGPSRRLIQFAIEDEAAMLHHDEPIYRNGLRVGAITSGGWGHHLGAAVGMGYAKVDEPGLINGPWVRESDWTIEIAGRSFPARASLLPLYDPKSHRVRG